MSPRAIFLFVALTFSLAACEQRRCDASSCSDGCCDADGACQPSNAQSCGLGGTLCQRCELAQVCNLGVCFGGARGGGSGTTCDATTCPNGCCDLRGTCQVPNANACGIAGKACGKCANNGYCNSAGECATGAAGGGFGTTGGGTGGAGGGAGSSGGGVGSSGGGAGSSGGGGGTVLAPGSIGASCNFDSDCTAVPTSSDDATYGWVPYCKRTSVTARGTPFSYSGGYCTRRCIDDSECGADSRCTYGLGRLSERDNFCTRNCVGGGDCRPGYSCFSRSTGTLCLPSAFTEHPADAGPPSTDASGGACAGAPCNSLLESRCLQSGGVSMCSAECDEATNPGAFCGPNSTCMVLLYDPADGYGRQLRGFCTASCDSTAPVSACRPGLTCGAQNGCWFP